MANAKQEKILGLPKASGVPITMEQLERLTVERIPVGLQIAVVFHNDGGQACIGDVKHFERKQVNRAREFAKEQNNQPGHNCGRNTVAIFLVDADSRLTRQDAHEILFGQRV